MHTARATTFRGLAALLAPFLVLTVAGCSSADDLAQDHAQGGGASGSEAGETNEPVDDGTEPADDEIEAVDDEVEAGADAPSAAACFLGAWNLDVASHQRLMDEAGGAMIQNAAGVVTVSFADDGTVTTTYDDWSYDIIVETAEAVAATDSTLRNGIDTGTYEVSAEGVATIADTSVDSEETVTSSRYGATTTTTESTGYSMFRTAPLTCEGDEITVALGPGTVTLQREG